MATTFRKHFDQDIKRAEELQVLSSSLQAAGSPRRLYQDVRLSGVALAVGALDAYLCDAYVDCLTTVLKSYRNGHWAGDLPRHYAKQPLPAGEVLDRSRASRPLWSIRMASRRVMERDNMLQLSRLPESFNGILPDRAKIWHGFIDNLVKHNLKRFTGYYQADLAKLTGSALGEARKRAAAAVRKRLASTIQLRHDWVHNCGRPKTAIKTISDGQAAARIREVRLFISEFDNHLRTHRKV